MRIVLFVSVYFTLDIMYLPLRPIFCQSCVFFLHLLPDYYLQPFPTQIFPFFLFPPFIAVLCKKFICVSLCLYSFWLGNIQIYDIFSFLSWHKDHVHPANTGPARAVQHHVSPACCGWSLSPNKGVETASSGKGRGGEGRVREGA